MEYTAKNWIAYVLCFSALYAVEFLCFFSQVEELVYLTFFFFPPLVLLTFWVPLRTEDQQRDFIVWLLRPWCVFLAIALVPCLFKVYFIAYIMLLLSPWLLIFTFGPFLFCLLISAANKPGTQQFITPEN